MLAKLSTPLAATSISVAIKHASFIHQANNKIKKPSKLQPRKAGLLVFFLNIHARPRANGEHKFYYHIELFFIASPSNLIKLKLEKGRVSSKDGAWWIRKLGRKLVNQLHVFVMKIYTYIWVSVLPTCFNSFRTRQHQLFDWSCVFTNRSYETRQKPRNLAENGDLPNPI